MMFYIVLGVLFIAFIFYLVAIRNGKLSFWRLASKHPDLVYELISNDENWIIDMNDSFKLDNSYTGPFRLYIPHLDKIVKFYCKFDHIERSQESISKKIELLSKIE